MKCFSFHHGRAAAGFTLIELLIVVAIIAILAAIAVPNFLEAQVRSKVSRTKADMRSIATGMESYFVDYNCYPLPIHGFVGQCFGLSTPVAYLTSVTFPDPFCVFLEGQYPAEWATGTYGYNYYSKKWTDFLGGGWYPPSDPATGQPWFQEGASIRSWGPDRTPCAADLWPFYYNHPTAPLPSWETSYTHWMDWLYDPTNGTKSQGDILRVVGNLECPQTAN